MDILIVDIKYDDNTRIRGDLDEQSLQELVDSFRNVGQITPIVVDHANNLIAGRRRLEAARRLSWEKIRIEYWEQLSPLDQKIVEFDENDKRRQLSWQEAARAISEIHTLKSAQSKSEGIKWTANDTAKALGVSEGKVREDLVLANALGNTRVAGRPSRRGALDTVKRERELEIVREIARRRSTDMGLGGHLNSTVFTNGIIYNEDCRLILNQMAPDSVDMVIADPPWGIDFNKSSQWTNKWISTYDDSEEHVRKVLVETFPLIYKVLKPTCHLYIFYPVDKVQWWFEQLTAAGFVVRQRPLIWFKTGAPGITDTYTSFLPAYESILWAFKPGDGGTRRLFTRPISEAYGFPREPAIWHENSKPIDLLNRWTESSSDINGVVLDPFAGGGSVLASAYGLGRYFIGVELDEMNYKKSVERMKSLEERSEDADNSIGTA